MNFLKNLKQIVYSACLYFTVAEFIILITATIMGYTAPEDGEAVGKFLNLSVSALLLLFAFVMSSLNLIWKADLPGAVKVLLHFIGSFATYTVLFIIIPGVYANVAQVIARTGIFAAAYFIIAFAVLLVSTIRKNRLADKSEYENKFGNS